MKVRPFYTYLNWKLITGIIVMPYIFSWFTLQHGFTRRVRVISFVWMILLVIEISGEKEKTDDVASNLHQSHINE